MLPCGCFQVVLALALTCARASKDPVEAPAAISGEDGAVVTGELGRSLNIRCPVYGFPAPSIYWYHDRSMLPYSSEQYEATGNVLQIHRLSVDTVGKYTCQAYSGNWKTALWTIVVRAHETEDVRSHEPLVPRGDVTVPSRPETQATTTPAPEIDVSVYTELPQAPQANPQTEPEVTAAEGGKATLRCLFHGNPPPKITWRRGEITIDGDVGRYRLLSDGALEIVSLYRNDSGVYICVADNLHGQSRQEVRLQVNDPVQAPVGISGEGGAVVTGELGRSLNIRCLAYGFPAPSIYWYRGRSVLPYSSEQYEVTGNVLQIRRLSLDTLGEYSCQAYNGVGKAALWTIVVRAYETEDVRSHELLVPRGDVTVPSPPETQATTTPAPEIDVPVYTVPVNTSIPLSSLTAAVGAELSIPCEVEGYPLPDVYWTKDGARLQPAPRLQPTEARLTISALTVEDSGVYGCHARNEYGAHSSTIQVNVQGLFIPVHCTDNPFFADCQRIVRSKFCHNQYYSKFCCKSCVEAGQLNPQELGTQADQAWKKK